MKIQFLNSTTFLKYSLLFSVVIIFCAFDNPKVIKKNNNNANTNLKSGIRKSGKFILHSKTFEISMLENSFFSIGTNNGISGTNIDDNCQITYGFPSSPTSFLLFNIDGQWLDPESYTQETSQQVDSTSNTLILTAFRDNLLKMTFSISLFENTGSVEFSVKMENIDTMPHKFGSGFLLDMAMGKNGDGYCFYDNHCFTNDSLLDNYTNGDLTVWERNSKQLGIGATISFPENKPSQIRIANWNDLFNDSDYNFDLKKAIYDLAIMCKWAEENVEPGEFATSKYTLQLNQPKIYSNLFSRWDMPTQLCISDGMLQPSKLNTYVEISNCYNYVAENIEVALLKNDLISNISAPCRVAIKPGETVYVPVSFEISEIYQDITCPLSIQVSDNKHIVDVLTRNVFIPGVKFSNEGLDVNIQSVNTLNFPEMKIAFDVKSSENSQLIDNIKSSGITLYEDNSEIKDFNFEILNSGFSEADIIFVLDVTGSMSEEINSLRENILKFADNLSLANISYRFGLVSFLDIVDGVYDFTADPKIFQSYLSNLYAHGGSDLPENSLEAINQAINFKYRSGAKKIIIWITDAPYHENNQYFDSNKLDITQTLINKAITVFTIANPEFKADYYDLITYNSGGCFFDIKNNFTDIFEKITSLEGRKQYIISYNSIANNQLNHNFNLEVYHAGLGGNCDYGYQLGKKSLTDVNNLNINNLEDVNVDFKNYKIFTGKKSGLIDIINTNGQIINQIYIPENMYIFDFKDDILLEKYRNKLVLIRVTLFDNKNGRVIFSEAKPLIINK